jgi:acetate kinase
VNAGAAILVFNGGSSSWKSALFEAPAADAPAKASAAGRPLAKAALTWHGDGPLARLEATRSGAAAIARDATVDRTDAVPALLAAYRELGCGLDRIAAVGHRLVHGGPRFRASVRVDDAVFAALRELEPFAPSHNPVELAGIAAARTALPDVPQIAAFDTAFHRTLAPAAFTYAGPYAWLALDIRRYGFHGINVAYCTERASRLLERPKKPRLIVAHLGGGCSVTAVRDGASVDTTMGFTPLDGVPMGTRSGGVDPGIATYLLRRMPHDTSATAAARELDETLNRRSGLLGLSGISSDVRDLEAAQGENGERARLALAVFEHRLAAAIASFLPALGRLDALVFSGGIGEHAAALRARVCARLAICGIVIDDERNAARSGDVDIAARSSDVRVLVVTAGEEWFIARDCVRVLAGTSPA